MDTQQAAARHRRWSGRRQGAGHRGLQHRASVAAVRARDRRVGHEQPADQGAGRQRARRGASDAGFGKPRIEGEDNGEWIIVDCGAAVVAHHAAGDPRVLPPRRDLGRQAGAHEARRAEARRAGQGRRREGAGAPKAAIAAPLQRRPRRRIRAAEQDAKAAKAKPARREAGRPRRPRRRRSSRRAVAQQGAGQEGAAAKKAAPAAKKAAAQGRPAAAS